MTTTIPAICLDGRTGRRISLFLSVVLAAVVSAVMGVVLGALDAACLLMLSFLLIGIIPWAIEIIRGRFDIFESKNMFIFLYLIQYCFSGFRLIGGESNDMLNIEAEYTLFMESVLFSMIGLLAFYIGYYTRLGKACSLYMPIPCRGISIKRARIVVVVFFLLGIIGAVILYRVGGGLFYVLSNLNYVRLVKFYGLTQYRYLLMFLSLSTLVAFLAVRNRRNPGGISRKCLLALMLFSVFVLGTVGHRLWAMFTILFVLIGYHYLYRKISIIKAGIILLIIVSANVLYVMYRDMFSLRGDLGDVLQSHGYVDLLASGFLERYHGIQSLAVVVRGIGNNIDFNYGLGFLRDMLLIPIPVSLWPERPDVTIVLFNRLFLGRSLSDMSIGGGVAITILGDLYWMGGVTAIVIGMMFLGVVHKAIYSYMRANMHLGVIAFYSVASCFLAQLVEGVSVYVVMFVVLAVPLLLALKFMSTGRLRMRSGVTVIRRAL